jgi:NADPH2:quinone reductase
LLEVEYQEQKMSVEALPKDMLAIKIGKPGGPDALGLTEIAVPTPGEGEILVKIEAAGVNRPNIIQRQGNYALAPGVNPIPGLEIASEVMRVGKNVDGFAIGDRVCALTNGRRSVSAADR